VHKRDIVDLLQDSDFLEANTGAHNLAYADVPYGFFDLQCDIVWDEATIRSVCTGVFKTLMQSGTFVVRLAGEHHDIWRKTLAQAGFHVDRDAHLLLQKPTWMKQKAYFAHTKTLNPMHYWLLARKDARGYFEAQKPFGKLFVVLCVV
jgi:hypothetical protein